MSTLQGDGLTRILPVRVILASQDCIKCLTSILVRNNLHRLVQLKKTKVQRRLSDFLMEPVFQARFA